MLIQDYLKHNSLESLKENYGISYNFYEDLVCLNYSQIDSVKTDPIVMECRGLILEKDTWEVIALPFTRFFNYGEALHITKNFNIEQAIYTEKLDGTLLTVFYYKGKWLFSTRSLIENDKKIGTSDITIKQLYYKIINRYTNFFVKLATEYTYTFEMVSPYNKIITPYSKSDLYLLTVRGMHLKSLKSFKYGIKNIAKEIGCKVPEHYQFSDIRYLNSFVNNLTGLKEGIVGNDKGLRVKFKNAKYVSIAHIKASLNVRAVLTLIYKKETEEFLIHFPEYIPYFEKVEIAWKVYLSYIELDILAFEDYNQKSRKDFATWAVNTVQPAFSFMMYDGKVENFEEYINILIKNKGEKKVFSNLSKNLVVDYENN
jgi:hypothetical protein